ncbi:phosphotransferase [Jeotgalibacillus sp. JSM ZJ347]|uniref:phosphotransferase n=1 Tax=Jeotgalibacillus sp. JSM ZJ347 TaxID=3342117 RepID=UPI0035A87B46
MEENKYNYLQVHSSLHINSNIGMLMLVLYLLFSAKSIYNLDRIHKYPFINSFVLLVRIIRAAQISYIYYKKKKLLKSHSEISSVISSHINGQCLIALRQGEYKVIDFKNKKVVTIFPEKVQLEDVQQQINKLIKAQSCDLAPEILNWDLQERCIVESYFNYRIPFYHYKRKKFFYVEIFPTLVKIMTSHVPKVISSELYFQKLVKEIHDLNNKYNKDKKHVNRIKAFVSMIQDNYERNIIGDVPLVFSHGDFCDRNILKSKKDIKVIDWSTLGKRSCYFDFYFILFTRISEARGKYRENIAKNVEIDLMNFNRFIKSHLDKAEDLSSKCNYRYLFYLEFITLRLEEFSINHDKQIDITQWIDIFEYYEEKVGDRKSMFNLEYRRN